MNDHRPMPFGSVPVCWTCRVSGPNTAVRVPPYCLPALLISDELLAMMRHAPACCLPMVCIRLIVSGLGSMCVSVMHRMLVLFASADSTISFHSECMSWVDIPLMFWSTIRVNSLFSMSWRVSPKVSLSFGIG